MARVYLLEADPLFRVWTSRIVEDEGHSVVLRLRPNDAVNAAIVRATQLTVARAASILNALPAVRVLVLTPTEQDRTVERLLGRGTRALVCRDDRPFLPRELAASLRAVLSANGRRGIGVTTDSRAPEFRVGP